MIITWIALCIELYHDMDSFDFCPFIKLCSHSCTYVKLKLKYFTLQFTVLTRQHEWMLCDRMFTCCKTAGMLFSSVSFNCTTCGVWVGGFGCVQNTQSKQNTVFNDVQILRWFYLKHLPNTCGLKKNTCSIQNNFTVCGDFWQVLVC